MKKLNITKEAFEKSKYFNSKYGKLEYVSESGKLFKTDKGKIVKFLKESCNKEDIFESNHTKLIPREKRKSSQKFNRFFKKLYAMNNGDDGKHHDRATRMEHPYDNVSVIFTSMLEIGHIDEPEVESHLRKVRSYIIKTAEENGWKWTYNRFGMSIEFIITEDLDEEQLNETSTMKKLNITKEGFEKSKYFTSKYGKLEYVSESGKLFKTNKGKILKFKESTKKFGKKFKESDEDNIPCPSCKGTNIDIDRDGNATCLDCDYSWELKDYTESVGDVSKDPAYVCPYCGSHDCEFDDANDIPDEGYFDGSTLNTQFWCNECGKPYNV